MNKLTAVQKSGWDLLETEIEALYRVRQSFWRLLPQADAAQEYKQFAADVRRSQVVGGYVVEYEQRSYKGRRYIAFMPRFAYMYEPYRTNKLMPRSGIGTALRVRLRHPFTPIYLLSDALPPSYFVLANAGTGIWTLRDEAVEPTWERGVLAEWATKEVLNMPPETYGLRIENEVPTFANAAGEARLARHPHYGAYNRLNPRWMEGYTLLLMAPLRLRKLAIRMLHPKPRL
jgi:hypothetical protein